MKLDSPPCMTKSVILSISRFELMPRFLQKRAHDDLSLVDVVWVSLVADFMVTRPCAASDLLRAITSR